ncbi:MAG: family 1 glycosylhydrolase, partial [Flavobacterium sp.]
DFIWGVSGIGVRNCEPENHDENRISDSILFLDDDVKKQDGDSFSFYEKAYKKYREELELMKSMGIANFRFSFSWSMIVPDKKGVVNPDVVAFYHRILDACCEFGIEPFVTLSNCDLPSGIELNGGWANREILDWFTDYVTFCAIEFKGKAKYWIILEEPSGLMGVGCFLGASKSGKKKMSDFLPGLHHLLLCQAIGYRKIKEIAPDVLVGTIYSCTQVVPLSMDKKDLLASKRIDALLNRLFIEPTLGFGYPTDILPFLTGVEKYILEGDYKLLPVAFDFIGLQNNGREVAVHSSFVPYLNAKLISGIKKTQNSKPINREAYSESLYQMVKKFSNYQNVEKIIVEERRMVFKEAHDKSELDYLKSVLEQLLETKQNGGKVAGYFIGSLNQNLDGTGLQNQHFGQVSVNVDFPKTYMKNSAHWYRKFLLGID